MDWLARYFVLVVTASALAALSPALPGIGGQGCRMMAWGLLVVAAVLGTWGYATHSPERGRAKREEAVRRTNKPMALK